MGRPEGLGRGILATLPKGLFFLWGEEADGEGPPGKAAADGGGGQATLPGPLWQVLVGRTRPGSLFPPDPVRLSGPLPPTTRLSLDGGTRAAVNGVEIRGLSTCWLWA